MCSIVRLKQLAMSFMWNISYFCSFRFEPITLLFVARSLTVVFVTQCTLFGCVIISTLYWRTNKIPMKQLCLLIKYKQILCTLLISLHVKNSNKKRACTGNVKIQNTENFWWCTMKVMIQVKFWTGICTIIILYIALIFYYIFYMDVTV